jgi:hypothetical protein
MKPKRSLWVSATIAAGLALASGASPANATAPPVGDGTPAVAFADTSASSVYGDSWYFQATAVNCYGVVGPWTGTGTISGAPAAALSVSSYWDSDAATTTVDLYPAGTGRPLSVGSYTFSAKVDSGAGGTYTVPQPARLTITPAPLSVQARVAADPSNPRNAIITAWLAGDFADNYSDYWGSTSEAWSPLTPAGSWKIEVKDSRGSVVKTVSAQRADTDDSFALSSYWLDVPAGQYTASATFTTSGATSADFTVSAGSPFAYTAPGPAPADSPTASAPPKAPPAITPVGSALPLWIPVAAGLLTAALLALLIVQIVRVVRLRRPPMPIGESQTGVAP